MFAGVSEEFEVFKVYYKRLAALLSVSTLFHHFVSARILAIEEVEELDAFVTNNKKAAFVLRKIGLDLKKGSTKKYYSLLSVMENYGDISSIQLVSEIRSGFTVFPGK